MWLTEEVIGIWHEVIVVLWKEVTGDVLDLKDAV